MTGQAGYSADAMVAEIDKAVSADTIRSQTGDFIKRWITEPQFGAFQAAVATDISAGNWEKLESCFWEEIAFGTGGRRGPMAEYGSATINERTIAESAYGLAAYFQDATGRTDGRAAISHDSRNRSREFAELTASVMAGLGLKVFLFEAIRSTPELSFAVRHLNCDVGVMISASHNPPADNGFKAQWEMFLRHVAEDAPWPYGLEQGAKGVQLATLGLKSWEERSWLLTTKASCRKFTKPEKSRWPISKRRLVTVASRSSVKPSTVRTSMRCSN